MRILSILILLMGIVGCNQLAKSRYEVQTQEITYKVGKRKMLGYLAKPVLPAEEKRPLVLVVHEWWGQTDYPRKRAEMLAEEGYIALAVDMYGDRKIADHPKSAGEFAKAAMKSPKEIARRFEAAISAAKKQPQVDASRISAIGYCFGGSVVMEMAKQGADLNSVVSFHGGLNTPTNIKKDKIKAPMLVLNGGADPMVPGKDIESFKKEMDAAKAEYIFKSYEGALHGFTNPAATRNGEKFKLPLAYDMEADKDSWARMLEFLANNFEK